MAPDFESSIGGVAFSNMSPPSVQKRTSNPANIINFDYGGNSHQPHENQSNMRISQDESFSGIGRESYMDHNSQKAPPHILMS